LNVLTFVSGVTESKTKMAYLKLYGLVAINAVVVFAATMLGTIGAVAACRGKRLQCVVLCSRHHQTPNADAWHLPA
jgi:hypothetical protein